MIHGNQFAQETLQKIITSLDVAQENNAIFLLLTGPKNVGKTTLAQELAKETLGGFLLQDFLYIQDHSTQMGKKHSIKVGSDSESDMIELPSGELYQDTTMREISYWLQQSAASGKKIVLLENIERMTIGSANAFLKAAEEPLPGRIIIATTSHPSQIMQTIVSRAILVPFQPLTDQEMQQFAKDTNLQRENTVLEELFVRMSMGRPGMLLQLSQLDSDLQKVFIQALQALQEHNSAREQQVALLAIHKAGYLHTFLDARIAQAVKDSPERVSPRLAIKKKLQTNVNVERLLLSAIIS